MSEATQVLEGIKSLTAEEPPVLDVQAIAAAAARKVVEALSAQPHAELGLPEADAVTTVMSSEKPTTVSASETPVMPQAQCKRGVIVLSAEVASLLRASLKANLPEVTSKVLRLVLECED